MPESSKFLNRFPKVKLQPSSAREDQPLSDNARDLSIWNVQPIGASSNKDSQGRPLPKLRALVDEDEGVIGFTG
jgi:hypothetical protein